MQAVVMNDRALWNLGFHRRCVWVNVYVNNAGTVVKYLVFDKKKAADRNHAYAFAATNLKCYRLRIGPSSWRPSTIWRRRQNMPPSLLEERLWPK